MYLFFSPDSIVLTVEVVIFAADDGWWVAAIAGDRELVGETVGGVSNGDTVGIVGCNTSERFGRRLRSGGGTSYGKRDEVDSELKNYLNSFMTFMFA